jgi:prepilin peptidase CpaA
MTSVAIALTVTMAAMLAVAAWQDVLTRTIPNQVSLGIAVLGLALRLPVGWLSLLASVTVAALVFAVLLVFAMRGWLGGGDVKLAAALAVGLSPLATWDFLIATILFGGVLGLIFVAGRRFAPRLQPAGTPRPLRTPPLRTLSARFLAIEARRLRRGGPLPYGVAIAFGGILVLLSGI